MRKIIRTLFLLGIGSFFIIALTFFASPAFAACSGKVTDENGQPLAGVKIELYTAASDDFPVRVELTRSDGTYTFEACLGTDISRGCINKIKFVKSGFQEIIIEYKQASGGSCPGNQVMISTSQGGYSCVGGTCQWVLSGGEYPTESGCQEDCGRFTCATDQCISDPFNQNAKYSSRKACQAECGPPQKWCYNPTTSSCLMDPNGIPLTNRACDASLPICGATIPKCGEGEKEGIPTALGCIPIKNTTQFIVWFLKFAIGIGGGIAFLLMLFGVFQIITSAGNPERLKAGQETITSAIIGLLMIIFSLFLLRLIGVEILKIPGLT